MLRKVCSLILVSGLLYATPMAAEQGQPPAAPQTRSRSTGKRVMWTVIGVGAGFGAGLLIGLNQFDDAINSDQKVWMSALLGAAGGGLAGGLLSRNVGAAPQVRASRGALSSWEPVAVTWQKALGGGSAEDHALRQRLRTSDASYSCRLKTNVCAR
jgi:hypothetical protein